MTPRQHRDVAPRARKVRILATLGPASSTPEMIERLFKAGADAFRINMSHGAQAEKVELIKSIRALEKSLGRPTTILADLQGPKLRVGKFSDGAARLETGQKFTLDRDPSPGSGKRVCLPHKEIFEALEVGARLLLDDGKLVLRVEKMSETKITTHVEVG
ncbi:MAG: pyruvate kinase, partial [Sphingomonadaceae bacterium]|nr:pyruvate kinase [Sphingomonadaceae bacterium]